MAEETELKLSVRPEHAGRIRTHPIVRRLKSGRARTKRMIGTYYDTPDLLLNRRDLSLRVRDVDRRHIQTIKRIRPGGGAIFVRDEWEQEVNGRAPDLRVIGDEGVRRLLAETGVAKSLRPMFRTDVQRTVWTLCDGHAEVELALDIGEILSETGGSLPVCEAELELKSGETRSLFEIALALSERVDCTIGVLSKSARGYVLCGGEVPPAAKAAALRLSRDLTVWEAFVAICRNCLTHLEANDAAARSDFDPERIHQARVAIRRLRAAFKTFKPALPQEHRARFAKELRWLQKQLGDARDLDVFTTEALAPLLNRLPDETALQDLQVRVERARGDAYAKAREALRSGRYGRMRLELERWFAAPPADEVRGASRGVRGFARRSVRKAHETVMSFGPDLSVLPEADLHELRIRGKQARYCVEFFAGLFPARAPRRHLKALIALQDCLGILNDGAVAKELLQRLGADAPLDAQAPPYILGWFGARIHDEHSRLEKIWGRLEAVDPYWA